MIVQIWENSKSIYGAPKIQKTLENQGYKVSLKRVGRYINQLNIRSIVIKKYRHHTTKISSDLKSNIMNRNFNTTGINQKWCTDITYIHISIDGWTYLVSVLDLHSKKILGYAYGKTMTTALSLKAVENACLNTKDTNGIILHSDLGTEYTSSSFESYLKSNGIVHSFSRKDNPYDNTPIESFQSLLKKMVNHNKYYDFDTARRAVFEYI